ncbi:MAG: DUF4250 domain-containing protein [Clostridiales bacterium]|nr:DUF4250 domain-containing protein [Clostridiales bacterium]MBR6484279.1 DUF4250 domain-containing protein [Clostridiales bacterium]
MDMPKDPVMLLSYINLQLRDYYPSLEEFAAATGQDENQIREKLASINYFYNEEANQFK